MNDLQKTELEILAEFSRVAERERLRWFVMFGTLLGAARHGGFIPWDDDVDIALPREDYDRLRLSEGWFTKPWFLQTPHSDPAAVPAFMRLRKDSTAVLIDFPDHLTRGGHMGAYIDIIPLDDVPDGESARELCNAAGNAHRHMRACAALDECGPPMISAEKEYFCYGAGGVAGLYPQIASRREALCARFGGMPYYAMPAISGERGGRVYDKEWFSESEQMRFESLTVPVPRGWREVLVASFPEGLLEPPEKTRKPKHTSGRVVDMNRSYKDYTRRYTDMLLGIEGKRVLLFGAGDSLRIWLERYSEGLEIISAIDNSEAKWGTKAYGVTVSPPGELPSLMDEKSRLIIASVYHEEIALQLEKMGITDYYIFVDGFRYERDDS
jgi:lipopolysaccharide cholinephosphotransferase